MKEPKVTPELALKLALSETEFSVISSSLVRIPTFTELRILAAYWSQIHSRTSTIEVLKLLPQLVEAGDDFAITLKTFSCYIQPGANLEHIASTGVVRATEEVRAMGAHPISIFYSRYVGSIDKRGTKTGARRLARGARACGKALELKTAPSHLVFDDDYNSNSLFNTTVLGVKPSRSIVSSKTTGGGNPVFILGRQNQSNGSQLSADLSLEKYVGYCCQELSQRSYLIGMRSVSLGGIALACIDLAIDGKCGFTLNLNKITRSGQGLTPSDILLSETTGQFIVVINKGFEKELRLICRNFGVDCVEIGEVNGNEVFNVSRGKKTYCSIPLAVLMKRTETLSHEFQAKEPVHLIETDKPKIALSKRAVSWNSILLSLLETPNVLVCEKIRSGMNVLDKSKIFLREGDLEKFVIFRTWASGRYTYLDPRIGGKCAITGAARKVVCRGAIPAAAVISINVGDLRDPEMFYMFREVVEGLAEACREFHIPVVNKDINCQSGVSSPTPVTGVFGLLDNIESFISPQFKNPNDFILMLGSHRGELGGSEYLKVIRHTVEGPPPLADVEIERRIHEIILMFNKIGLVKSAHDVSTGGLAVALAHCLIGSNGGLGARIHMSSKIREDELLFGETQGLFIITIDEDSLIEIERLCMRMGVSCTAIGRVTDSGIFSFNRWIRIKVDKLKKLYSQNIRKMPIL